MRAVKEKPARRLRSRLVVIFLCVAAVFAGLWVLTEKLDEFSRRQTLEQPEEPKQQEPLNPLQPGILEGLAQNPYDLTQFTSVDGRITYGGQPCFTGVDVSSHQQEIDWQRVRQAGVDYAMIRVGYRGYTQGKLEEDAQFKTNIEGALAAGLSVGVYFFSQAITEEEAREEARFVLERIEDYDITYPVIFDWENIEQDARTDGMDSLTLTKCAGAFCQTVQAAGYRPGLYFNQIFGYQQFNLLDLQDYEFWLAQYSDVPDFYYAFQMWQYTNVGIVDGIAGAVDLNLSLVDYGQ